MNDDVISRSAAIRWVKTECNPYGKPTLDFESGKKVIKHLEQMPPVQSEPQWIPVTEDLPKDDDWKLVTIIDEFGDSPYKYTDFGWYLEAAKCWIVDSEQRTDIVAWKPLPEPWAGENDEHRRVL